MIRAPRALRRRTAAAAVCFPRGRAGRHIAMPTRCEGGNCTALGEFEARSCAQAVPSQADWYAECPPPTRRAGRRVHGEARATSPGGVPMRLGNLQHAVVLLAGRRQRRRTPAAPSAAGSATEARHSRRADDREARAPPDEPRDAAPRAEGEARRYARGARDRRPMVRAAGDESEEEEAAAGAEEARRDGAGEQHAPPASTLRRRRPPWRAAAMADGARRRDGAAHRRGAAKVERTTRRRRRPRPPSASKRRMPTRRMRSRASSGSRRRRRRAPPATRPTSSATNARLQRDWRSSRRRGCGAWRCGRLWGWWRGERDQFTCY